MTKKTTPIDQKPFVFSQENLIKAKEIIQHYPEGRQASAILPLFDLAQRQNKGWLSESAIECVAQFLGIPVIKAYEVASFYTLFNLKHVGKYVVQVCGTTPCMLRGSHELLEACEDHLEIQRKQTTSDALFTLQEVECLGACKSAPLMCINDEYYDNMTPEKAKAIFEKLKQNHKEISKRKISSKNTKEKTLL